MGPSTEGKFLLSAIPGGSALATALAGLLTYDSDEIHTFPHLYAVAFAHLSSLTAARTVPDLHRFPLGQQERHICKSKHEQGLIII